MGSPPPLLLKMSKRKPKKNYPKTFGFGFAPPPPFGQCPKGSSFFFRMSSLSELWQETCYTRHVTHETWHMTCDMFGGVNILSKFQLPRSYRLWFMILWKSGGKGSLNELMNDGGDYRTAPATSGLLKTSLFGWHNFKRKVSCIWQTWS